MHGPACPIAFLKTHKGTLVEPLVFTILVVAHCLLFFACNWSDDLFSVTFFSFFLPCMPYYVHAHTHSPLPFLLCLFPSFPPCFSALSSLFLSTTTLGRWCFQKAWAPKTTNSLLL